MKLITYKFLENIHRIKIKDIEVGIIEVDDSLPSGLTSAMDDESYLKISNLMESYKILYLENLTIYSEYRIRGYGAKALKLLHKKAKEDGYDYIVLTPVPSKRDYICDDIKEYWEILNKFYNSQGYTEFVSFDFKSDYTDKMKILIKDLRE